MNVGIFSFFAILLMLPYDICAATVSDSKAIGVLEEYALVSGIVPLKVPEVSPVYSHSRSDIDIDKLCQGKSLCFLDSYVPAKYYIEKWSAQDIFESLLDSSNPLNLEEKTKIKDALIYLSRYPFGESMCKGITGGECTIETLENKGVYVKAKVMAIDRPVETILRGGKILIILNRQPKFSLENSIYWATYLGHELSHAEDYKRHGKALTEIYRADTETKAVLSQMYVYNQIKPFYPGSVEFPVMDFMIRYWAWKENGGAKPPDFYNYSSPWTADRFSSEYLEDASSGVMAIRNVTVNLYYTDELTGVYPNPNDKIHLDLFKSINAIATEYTKWRNDNPDYAFPVFIHEIKPQNSGTNGGGGGGPGGGYNPTINPHPGFTPGGGAIY